MILRCSLRHPQAQPMNSVVKVYELLGAEVFLYFDVDGTQITARVDPRTTAKTGDPIRFASRYGESSLLRQRDRAYHHKLILTELQKMNLTPGDIFSRGFFSPLHNFHFIYRKDSVL